MPGQRLRSRSFIVGIFVLATTLSFVRGQADEGLRVRGFMPFGLKPPFSFVEPANGRVRFIVDPRLHRGFLLTKDGNGAGITVYDLARLKRVGWIAWPAGGDLTGNEGAAVDEAHHRIFLTDVVADATSPTACDGGTRFVVVDTVHLKASATFMPCVDGLPFAVDGLSYDATSDKLYVIGMYAHESATLSSSSGVSYVEPTRLAQLDSRTLKSDWAVDASSVCEWHEVGSEADNVSVVARLGHDLVSFCYRGGYAYNFGGERGEVVDLPIRDGKPVQGSTGPAFRTSPTFTGAVTPTIDPATGRFLLYSTDPPYGRAVWGYDSLLQRFFGVVPAGEHSTDLDDRFQGFDPATGRLYITNPKGVVLVDARQDVLSGGVTYPALAHSQGGKPDAPAPTGFSHDIAIDGGLHRLFIPYPKRGGFVVVEDRVPIPDDSTPADPDLGTADIQEQPGKTESAFSGAADAFGVHTVMVGGVPGAIDNLDQACYGDSPVVGNDPDHRCLADQAATPGNRENFMAQTGSELGSDSGALGFAAVFRVPSDDTATDTDFRSLAECFTARLPAQVPGSIGDGVASSCRDRTPLGQFQNGSHNRDGSDAPFPGSLCVDETGKAAEHDSSTLIGSSRARCDLSADVVRANAEAAAAAVPDTVSPVISVAHASSSIVEQRTSDGLVTTVTAIASGVRIAGTFSIGQIYTQAITVAHGRTGTTKARFKTVISDVAGPGIECAATCRPQAVVDAFNQAFASQAHMRLPEPFTLASPRGYQSLVVKDPGLRASDVAIVNDDSDTFDGLDLILYNDGANANTFGPNARSRLLVEFAGVHAESRYGIFPLSSGGGGTEVLGEPPLVQAPVSIPPTSGLPMVPPPSVSNPPRVARVFTDAWGLIVNHPAQAALLFVLLGLLASPVYLGLRSRSLARSLQA